MSWDGLPDNHRVAREITQLTRARLRSARRASKCSCNPFCDHETAPENIDNLGVTNRLWVALVPSNTGRIMLLVPVLYASCTDHCNPGTKQCELSTNDTVGTMVAVNITLFSSIFPAVSPKSSISNSPESRLQRYNRKTGKQLSSLPAPLGSVGSSPVREAQHLEGVDSVYSRRVGDEDHGQPRRLAPVEEGEQPLQRGHLGGDQPIYVLLRLPQGCLVIGRHFREELLYCSNGTGDAEAAAKGFTSRTDFTDHTRSHRS